MFTPFQNKQLALWLTIMCASAVFWGYQCNRIWNRETEKEATLISLSMDCRSEFESGNGKRVSLEGYKRIGSGFWLGGEQKISEYQALAATNNTSDNPSTEELVIAFYHREPDAASLWLALSERKFNGIWYEPRELENENLVASMEKYYPGIDSGRVAFVKYEQDSPAVAFVSMLCLSIGSVLMIPLCMGCAWHSHHQNERWVRTHANDRRDRYRNHPRAMRLVGEDRFIENGLPCRRVDESFDVQEPKRPRLQKLRRGFLLVAQVAASITFGCIVGSFLTPQSVEGQNMQSLVMIVSAAVVNAALMWLTDKKLVGRERKLSASQASHRRHAFHQYHSEILKELRFTEVGDFKLTGLEQELSRTIFFSRQGNLLVEIGTESAKPYFAIETITNDGKILETHSLVAKSQEKRNVLGRHQRRSANHEDILLALETHDELVAEFTNHDTVLEAQFTEDKFPRFLAIASQA